MWKNTIKILSHPLKTIILLIGLLAAGQAFAGAELIMVEENGCVWCARWDAEIGPIFPKTDVGKAAPLRRIDIHQPIPTDLKMARPLRFTPTFVLVIDGIEKTRLEGYPGEDFFWGLFEKMLEQNSILFEIPSK